VNVAVEKKPLRGWKGKENAELLTAGTKGNYNERGGGQGGLGVVFVGERKRLGKD